MSNLENCPLVSIVIPVFNHEKYIQECVDSCLAQTYPHVEIIVVDDGSTDNTPNILAAYGDKITTIRQSNKGAAVALNAGFERAKGEYVAWLSSDDIYLPEKTAAQIKLFLEKPEFDIIYTDSFHIDSEGKTFLEHKSEWYPPEMFFSKLMFKNFINGTSILMRKKAWESAGRFNEEIPAVVDGYMWFTQLEMGFKFGHVPQTLVKYRIHNQSQSSNWLLMRTYSDVVHSDFVRKLDSSVLFPYAKTDEEIVGGYKHLANFYFQLKEYQAFINCYDKIKQRRHLSIKEQLRYAIAKTLNNNAFYNLFNKYHNYTNKA